MDGLGESLVTDEILVGVGGMVRVDDMGIRSRVLGLGDKFTGSCRIAMDR